VCLYLCVTAGPTTTAAPGTAVYTTAHCWKLVCHSHRQSQLENLWVHVYTHVWTLWCHEMNIHRHDYVITCTWVQWEMRIVLSGLQQHSHKRCQSWNPLNSIVTGSLKSSKSSKNHLGVYFWWWVNESIQTKSFDKC